MAETEERHHHHHHHHHHRHSGRPSNSAMRAAQRSNGGRSHHKHHTLHGRIKSWLRHHRWIWAAVLLVLIALLVLFFYMRRQVATWNSRNVTAGVSAAEFTNYRNITWNGRHYRYKNNIRTILVAGLDSTGKIEENEEYGNSARNDSMQLIVLDRDTGKLEIIAMPRNTICKVGMFSKSGVWYGKTDTFLCYAYALGNGGKASCTNMTNAVTDLLMNIPVNEYLVFNISSLTGIMDQIGSLTVTVPNDDLTDLDASFKKGARVTITSENVEMFLRDRNIGEHFTNNGRMERQKAFMEAYLKKMKSMLEDDIEALYNQIDQVSEYVQTSITRNKYIDLANRVLDTEFSEDDYHRLEGEDVVGQEYDEFHPDEEKLEDMVIDLFYNKRND